MGQTSPAEGATVPSNAQVVFLANTPNTTVEGTLYYQADDDPTALTTSNLHCTDQCVGVVDDLTLRVGQPEMTLGTNLEYPTTVQFTVVDAEDLTPPTIDDGLAVTSTYAAYQGEHLGYDLQVTLPLASDNYGIGYYLVRMGTSAEGDLPHTNSRVPGADGTVANAWAFIDADAAQACAEVTAFDYAGHSITSDRVCVDNVPPTDDELAATIYYGGCFGGAEPVAPGFALLGFFGLGRLARRRRR